jgi:hypothetical protein
VAQLLVLALAPASWRAGRGLALRLPVEQALVDGVVLVHGRGRKHLLGLVERDQEKAPCMARR